MSFCVRYCFANFEKMGRKNIQKNRYKDPLIKEKYVMKLLVYFQKNGIRNFSMSQLAQDFNVSKTTLYNHFESKEEMVEKALDYKLSVIGEYESVLENITLPYKEISSLSLHDGVKCSCWKVVDGCSDGGIDV